MAASLPTQIRSLIQADRTSTDVTITTIPIPIPPPNSEEHLIKVYATAPCAGELLWLKNFPQLFSEDRYDVPCYDLAGVVVTAPEGSPFPAGTEVFTRTPASGSRGGNAREYSTALTSELAVKPKNLTWEEAASVPLSAFSAYQALFEHGGIKAPWREGGADENAKKRIIVTAASGGVGSLVVQLAKAAGVGEIIAVVGPKNVDFVKELGATEVVNYRAQSLGEWAAAGNAKADMIIDMVGGQTLVDSWKSIKDGGILLSIKQPPQTAKPEDNLPKDVKDSFFIMEPTGWQLKEVADLLEQGQVKPIIDSIYSFEDYQKAFDKVEGGHARGKVIITI